MKRAVVVSDGVMRLDSTLGALAAAGFEAVEVGSTAQARGQIETGAVVAVIGASGAEWGGERAQPIASMPQVQRRGCVVVLIGNAFATGDGSRAFMLGVDAVISTSDLARLGEFVSRAVAAKRALIAPLDPTAAARLGA